MKHLKHLNKYFLKYKWWVLPGLVFVVIANIFGVVPAKVIGQAMDLITDSIVTYRLFEGFERQELIYNIFSRALLFCAGTIVVLYLLRGLFLFFMRQTIILMSRHIEYDMKNEIYAHYQKLNLSFYRRNNTGDLLNRATEDVNRVRMYVGPAIMYTTNTVVLFLLIIYAMFRVNATLAFYCLVPLPILVGIIYYVNQLINQKSEVIQRQLSNLSSFVQERFSGIRVIKSYVQEKQTRSLFAQQSNTYRDENLNLVKIQAVFFPTMMLLVGISTIATVYVGGIEVMKGAITAGNIAEFFVYVNQLTFPVTMLGWVTSLIQRAAASQKRINEFLQTEPEITNPSLKPFDLQGHIEFKDVSFVYPDTGIKALKNLNFELQQGQFLAVIGKTGSGKTTLANLLMRMYEADEGAILIDHQSIKTINLEDYRAQIGFVPQEVFLFSDSIKNNIAFGLDEVEEAEVIQAAKDASVYHNIMGFEHQFDTLLGERGITLSGGQKQRVSIARALIKKPKMLVFDDCLSAVDTKTEEEILRNLGRLMKGHTSVVIAHRISTIKNADHILVLDQGEIVEQGNHEDLLLQSGIYADLYKAQQLEMENSEKI